MKFLPFLVATLFLGTESVFAETVQQDGHDHHTIAAVATTESAANVQPWVDAIVRKVDIAGGRIMISHGPIPNLGMGAMTMVFPVRDPAWLTELKPATKLRVVFEEINGEATVVQLERIKK